MNYGIDSKVRCLSYITVDDVARAIEMIGERTILAKLDVKSACQNITMAQKTSAFKVWLGREQYSTC